MIKLRLIFISFILFLALSSFAKPTFASVCDEANANNSSCEQCTALSGCSWGGPTGDYKCRDTGSNNSVCPGGSYSLWYMFPNQCGTSTGNYCQNNTTAPPPSCSTFNNNCTSCLAQSACGYSDGLCLPVDPAVGNICPSGYTKWNWYDCSTNQCQATSNPTATAAPGCSTYSIQGYVRDANNVGIPGAKVCTDPSGGCPANSPTTNSSGNYAILGVPTGGSGHRVYLDPTSVPNYNIVSSNPQFISGSVCQTTTINFNVTVIPTTGQGYSAQMEQCRNDGSGWDTLAANQCTNLCGTPASPTCLSPRTCSSSNPSNSSQSCSQVTTFTCSVVGQSCWSCQPIVVTPPSCPTTSGYSCSSSSPGSNCSVQSGYTCSGGLSCYYCPPAGTPSCPTTTGYSCSSSSPGSNCNPQPGYTCTTTGQTCYLCTPNASSPWIQTTGGDVHSNTNIKTPGGP